MLTSTKARIEPGKLLIGGEWVSASQTFNTVNPATGDVRAPANVSYFADRTAMNSHAQLQLRIFF